MTALPVAALIEQAALAQRQGDIASADAAYRQALAQSVDDARALAGLGIICYQTGRYREAIEKLRRAIEVGGAATHLCVNLGLALHANGAYGEAIESFQAGIRMAPGFAPAHNSLGVSLLSQGLRDEALDAFKQAVALDPNHARAWFNLGTVQRQRGDLSGATISFRRACQLVPNFAQGYAGLAGTLQDHGDWAAALENYRTALQHDPADVVVLNNLAQLLAKRGETQEATALLERAVALAPLNPTLLVSLGNLLNGAFRYAEASSALRKALALEPRSKDAWINLGHAFGGEGKWVEAVGAYETAMINGWSLADGNLHVAAIMADQNLHASARAAMEAAIKAEPNNSKVLYRWGMILLKRGELAVGWDMYEKRFYDQANEFRTFKKRPSSPPPYWEGEDLTGKSILVWREQGLGEEILGVSMIPDLLTRARHCAFACNQRMAAIYRRSFPGLEIIDFAKQTDSGAARMDFQSPLLSLGRFLRREFSAFPSRPSHLAADPERAAALRDKYRKMAGGRKVVGVAWASKNDLVGLAKTGDIADWAPILQARNAWFVNLQYGDCRGALEIVREKIGVEIFQDASVDPMGDLDDFFAQLSALDLVISTSNTGVHAAGALGVETWVLLPRGRGTLWPWFEDREDSPWYKSVRLLRQPADAPRDQPWWHEPVARAGAMLARLEEAR